MNTPLRMPIMLMLIMMSTASAQTCIAGCGNSEALDGTFVVVDLRRSSMVEGGPDDISAADWIGREVVFDNSLLWIDGKSCEDWSIEKVDRPIDELSDPNLSDLEITPVDSSSSSGDARRTVLWRALCGDELLGHVIEIDNRVLVINSPSGLTNAILERPLSQDEITALQLQLIDMKFYEGDANGTIDEATSRAISAYAEYRGAEYRFYRAAITENLLDGLGVLQD